MIVVESGKVGASGAMREPYLHAKLYLGEANLNHVVRVELRRVLLHVLSVEDPPTKWSQHRPLVGFTFKIVNGIGEGRERLMRRVVAHRKDKFAVSNDHMALSIPLRRVHQ